MLLEKLNDAVKDAMRNKDAVTRDTLRGVVADIKLAAKESIEAYTAGNRSDLADEEQAKLNALAGFLPKQMTEEEVRSLVEKTIAEQGLDTSNKGLLMKNLMPLFKGKADGKMVNEIIASFVK